MLSINIIGVTNVQSKINNTVNNDKLEKALDKAAMLVERDAKYQVRVDTGRLRSSINVIPEPLKRYIGTSVIYAAAQEFGRPDLSKYGYTPYLRPALRKNQAKIQQLIKEAL